VTRPPPLPAEVGLAARLAVINTETIRHFVSTFRRGVDRNGKPLFWTDPDVTAMLVMFGNALERASNLTREHLSIAKQRSAAMALPPDLPRTSSVNPGYLDEVTTRRYRPDQNPERPRTMLPPPPDLGDE
jgi:hypothetical protein